MTCGRTLVFRLCHPIAREDRQRSIKIAFARDELSKHSVVRLAARRSDLRSD